MAAWTDLEYGDVAEALDWPRDRIWRYPIFPWLSGPDQPAQLDGRLSVISDLNKPFVLAKARDILALRIEVRKNFFAMSPSVTRYCDTYKDERKGYRDAMAVLDDMQAELARLVDYYPNPAAALGSGGQPFVIG